MLALACLLAVTSQAQAPPPDDLLLQARSAFDARAKAGQGKAALDLFARAAQQKSLDYLRKAVQGCPTNALPRLFYAETLKSEGQKDKAREQLRVILTMQPDPRWAAEHPSICADAEKLLKKLGG